MERAVAAYVSGTKNVIFLLVRRRVPVIHEDYFLVFMKIRIQDTDRPNLVFNIMHAFVYI